MSDEYRDTGSGEFRFAVPAFVGLVALMLFIGSQMPHPAAPKPAAPQKAPTWHGMPDYINDAEGTNAFILKIARRTGGDYSKLTEDERRWMDGIGGANAPEMLRHVALSLPHGPKPKQKHAEATP